MISLALTPGLASLEGDIMHFVTCRMHHPVLGRFFQVIQSEWVGVPLFLFGVAWITRRNLPLAARALATGAAAFGISMGIATIMWATIDRQRPPHAYERWLHTESELAACATMPEAFPVRSHVSGRPSFPSRHALTIGSFAGALFLASRGLGCVAWVYGWIVVLGRVYVGKHWPTDLLAGLLIGAGMAWLCWRWVPKLFGALGLGAWVDSDRTLSADGTPQ